MENEKIEADKLVRLNELKLKLILENIGEGIIVTDSQKRIVLSNHMAEEIIGIKQDSAIPTTLDWSAKYDLYYPDEQTIFPAQNLPLEKALKGESTDDVEIIIENSETKDKKRVVISGRPIIDENNYIIAAVANIKDITYYKELEVALEESEQKYRKLIGFKSDKK
jgi:PAS domain-containing protein